MKRNTDKIKVVFCAGGTGGHIYPAIAVADRLKLNNRLNEIRFFVSGRDIERSVFSQRKYPVKEIPSARTVRSVISAFAGMVISFAEFIRNRPDVIVSMGGYSGIPPVIAGYLLRIPIILHEQNALPGKANRFLAVFAQKVALSFERGADSFPKKKIRITGNPVREEILACASRRTAAAAGTLLVMGGSQGAAAINDAVIEMLGLLGDRETAVKRIIHITGPRDHARVSALTGTGYGHIEYSALSYADRIWEHMAVCGLVISRAGATAIAEINASRLPSILVPYPYASERHQDVNAQTVENAGAAKVIPQDKLSGRYLLDIIDSLLGEPDALRRMSEMSGRFAKPDAARNIVELIYETA